MCLQTGTITDDALDLAAVLIRKHNSSLKNSAQVNNDFGKNAVVKCVHSFKIYTKLFAK